MRDPSAEAAEHARAVFRAAVDAVRADTLIQRNVRLVGNVLTLGPEAVDLNTYRRVVVVGAGKASAAMASAMETVLGDQLSGGLVVTKDGHALPTSRIEVLEAAHPVPDDRSVEAGRRILEMVRHAGQDSLVLCLLSGGASSLIEVPEVGVSLSDLQMVTSLLLRAGAPIDELNAVRSCLSQVKAGGLARAAGDATLICLALSDVLGNPLDVIGSGPCLARSRDRVRAMRVLESRGVREATPASVLSLLASPESRGESASTQAARHVIVGDIWTALRAARDFASASGMRARLLTGWLQGEAREVGRVFGAIARDMPGGDVDCYIAGGETTVTVKGSGKGGRSQELAASAALAMEGVEGVALLAAGTDGTDGPTDAAGGLVDGQTAARARAAGRVLTEALTANDTYPALAAAGGLLTTGPTHTNVGDLVVIVNRTTDH